MKKFFWTALLVAVILGTALGLFFSQNEDRVGPRIGGCVIFTLFVCPFSFAFFVPIGLMAESNAERRKRNLSDESQGKEPEPSQLAPALMTVGSLLLTALIVSPLAYLLFSNYRGKGVALIVVVAGAPIFFGLNYLITSLTGIKPMGLQQTVGKSEKLAPREKSDEGPACPECGKQLRTSNAKQCIQCGADWH